MSQSRREPGTGDQSFLQVAAVRLGALTAAAGFSESERAAAVSLLDELLRPWGEELVGEVPRMSSDIGDDHFPIELSLALGGRGVAPEVRVLFEARTAGSSMMERWRVGQELCARLESRHGANLQGLRLIEDLFVPLHPRARYAIWHSVCLRRQTKPKFKIYLNPQAQGEGRAPVVISQAMGRLGFERACDEATMYRRPSDRYKFFSLDLAGSAEARVKTYKVHPGATRIEIEVELAAATSYSPGVLDAFWRIIAAGDGPFDRLAPSTYLSWRAGDGERPSSGTLHFPLRAHVDDDQVARERICRFLPDTDRAIYESAVGAFARRSLADGVGLHAYVSLAIDRGAPRVTIYLAPEVYAVAPSRGAASSVELPAPLRVAGMAS
jgi:hypothetical protein